MTKVLNGRIGILVLLFINCLPFKSISQHILDTKITVVFEKNTVKEAINILKSTTDIPFAFAESLLDKEKKQLTYSAKNESLQKVLNEVFKGTKIDFKVVSNKIILFQNQKLGSIDSNNKSIKKNHTLSGYISDATTGEKLIGANIYEIKEQTGTSANVHGFFTLTLPSNKYQLAASYIGYETQLFEVDLTTDQAINFSLSPNNNLTEIVVTADKDVYQHSDKVQMSVTKLDMQQVKTLPAIGGEVDVMKIIQLQPGISAGVEGSSGLHVRGGNNDQNLILLDGVPLYNPSHLFGFVSVFNEDAINSMEVIKGGFPARYSGRLSSILDIRMKEGNSKEFEFGGTLSPISSKLYAQGPIIKDKMSFLVTARRTFVDYFMKSRTRKSREKAGDGGTSAYYFYDLNAKWNYKISDKDQIYFSYFRAKDDFNDTFISENDFGGQLTKRETISDISWKNELATFKWNHKFGNRLFGNFIVSTTGYNYNLLDDEKFSIDFEKNIEKHFSKFEFQSDIKDYSARYNLDFVPSNNHYIRIGGYGTLHRFKPGVSAIKLEQGEETVDSTFNDQNVNTKEFGIYVEDEIKVGKKLTLNIGLAANLYQVDDKVYQAIEPRFSSAYKISENTAFKFSYTEMNQYLHLLASNGVGLPSDLWVPVTKNIKPQFSRQFALGVAHDYNQKYSIVLEGYYKTLDNLIEYEQGTSFLNSSEKLDERITTGKGDAYGVEFELKKNFGKTRGWLSYTWSKSNRKFAGLNGGKTFPFAFDRRHDASIVLTHQLNKRWTIGGNWVFYSGRGITVPNQFYDGNSSVVSIQSTTGSNEIFPNNIQYGNKNSYRLKPYHRMDLSISYRKETRWGENTFSLSAYNAYNRANTFYIKSETNNDKISYSEVSYFSFIPGISYSFKFKKKAK